MQLRHPSIQPIPKEKAMRKWLAVSIVAAVSAAAIAPTLAGAASPRKCSLNLSFVSPLVKSSGNPPLIGTETRASTVDGKLCGKQFHGAARLAITYFGPGKPSTTLDAIFGPAGSLRATVHAVGTPHPDGSVSISGSGKVTGGTGVYKGAVGSFSVTGSASANSTITKVHDVGTIRF
jgi:hypothetical protein